MKPTRLWIGLVFVAIGVFGILDATEVLEWDTTIGDWWPVAVIGYGVAGMLTDRRITFWGLAITGVGAAVLIDEQAWEGEGAIWSGLFLLMGAAILFGWFGGREDTGSEDAGLEDAGFWDWCAGWSVTTSRNLPRDPALMPLHRRAATRCFTMARLPRR